MIFDRASRSIVVVCDCGAREVFPDQISADMWAVDHFSRCTVRSSREHENAIRASQAIDAARQRAHRRK